MHLDTWGPYSLALIQGPYFLTIIDDSSRGTWIYLMQAKEEAPTFFEHFVKIAKTQFNEQMKSVKSNNVAEFLWFQNYLLGQGIFHQTSCPHTPQQNSVVEQKHKHLLEVARALCFQYPLLLRY